MDNKIDNISLDPKTKKFRKFLSPVFPSGVRSKMQEEYINFLLGWFNSINGQFTIQDSYCIHYKPYKYDLNLMECFIKTFKFNCTVSHKKQNGDTESSYNEFIIRIDDNKSPLAIIKEIEKHILKIIDNL